MSTLKKSQMLVVVRQAASMDTLKKSQSLTARHSESTGAMSPSARIRILSLRGKRSGQERPASAYEYLTPSLPLGAQGHESFPWPSVNSSRQ